MENVTFHRALIDHEIRHHIAAAAADGTVLRSSVIVAAILRAHPDPSLSARELSNIVIEAAYRARIPVEMDCLGGILPSEPRSGSNEGFGGSR